jgi:two-component system response regulator HydG
MAATKYKIVIIDDDQDTLDLIAHFFKARGYSTHTYLDALLAYEDILNAKIECDVVVSDLSLPSISGIEFTSRMRAAGNQTPIILITANKKVEIAVDAIRAGAYDFVVKPIHFPQLLISVERALHLTRVEQENSALKTAVKLQEGPTSIDGVIGKSAGVKRALDLAKRVSKSTANVLITGESGTGKEVIAKTIHAMGPRRKAPFIAINCSAIPENLLESELFGYAKGSFTGASEKRIGLFEEAEGGTLFLDEIGDLNFGLQSKLLRVLQERKIKRIGENQYRPVDTRIIAATHKDLRKEVANKNFREDLFFRLNVIPIWIPPLRERREDIVPLAEFFLKKFSALNGSKVRSFSKECMDALLTNNWQGNVRELENTIERAVVLSDSDRIEADDIRSVEGGSPASVTSSQAAVQFNKLPGSRIMPVEELVNLYVRHVLDLNDGIKEKTAKDLQIDRKTLYRRLREIESQTHEENSSLQ